MNVSMYLVHTVLYRTYYIHTWDILTCEDQFFSVEEIWQQKEEKGEEKVTHLETTIAFWRKEASGFFACLLTCFPCFFCEKVASSRLNFQFVFVLFQCQVVIIKKGKKWFEETSRKRYTSALLPWFDEFFLRPSHAPMLKWLFNKNKKKKESVPWYRT